MALNTFGCNCLTPMHFKGLNSGPIATILSHRLNEQLDCYWLQWSGGLHMLTVATWHHDHWI